MDIVEKIHKFEGEEFLLRESKEGCDLSVTYGGATLTIRPSTEIYGTGFRIYHSSNVWKGAWNTPAAALDAACRELLSLSKGKTENEWCKELQCFFDELP